VLLPPEALVQREGANAVFVVNEGRAQQRAVTLGADVGKFRLVTQGLKAGEAVVVSPPVELKNGSNVVSKE
jgi:HlyD family secretion protein